MNKKRIGRKFNFKKGKFVRIYREKQTKKKAKSFNIKKSWCLSLENQNGFKLPLVVYINITGSLFLSKLKVVNTCNLNFNSTTQNTESNHRST